MARDELIHFRYIVKNVNVVACSGAVYELDEIEATPNKSQVTCLTCREAMDREEKEQIEKLQKTINDIENLLPL